MHALGPNADLIGRPGSRSRLQTPALVLDLDAFDANLATMAERARAAGKALRPHAKTHKCAEIARRQRESGACGITCATLAEAEAMVRAAMPGVLLSSPVVHLGMIERLTHANLEADGLMVVVDHPANAVELDRAAGQSGKPLDVLVDLDVGSTRTGVVGAEQAVALATTVRDLNNLRYRGLQAYYGHLQHIIGYAERAAAADAQKAVIRGTLAALVDAELEAEIVTGSGTGTHHIDLTDSPFTELQVGSYVFTDRHYNEVELDPNGSQPFRPSLFVAATVTSVNHPGLAIIDAGYKAFATDSDVPVVFRGAPPATSYAFKGDEHGGLAFDLGAMPAPALGDVVELLTPHCDPTVNLHDYVHVVRGEKLVAIWPIEARGH